MLINAARCRSLHPVGAVNRQLFHLAQCRVCCLSDDELTREVIMRWRHFEEALPGHVLRRWPPEEPVPPPADAQVAVLEQVLTEELGKLEQQIEELDHSGGEEEAVRDTLAGIEESEQRVEALVRRLKNLGGP